MRVCSLGQRSPGEENGNMLQYSCVENPMGREAWQAIDEGVTRVRHNLVTKPPQPLTILISSCALSSPAFHMMFSAYNLNKQGDNMYPWHSPFPIWNQSVIPCPVLCVGSWPVYRFLRRQVRWSGILISLVIFQFVMIHTIKGFSIINETEVDVFFWNSCFFNDPTDVGNLTSGSSAFSKPSLNIWMFSVHVLLKPRLENFECYFTSVWSECSCAVVWSFFGNAFLWDWNENRPFPILWPLLYFPNLLAYWVQHFHSIIF